MFNLIFLFILSMIIPLLIITLNFFLSTHKYKNREKMTPFECGFDPMTNSRMPFSIQFFMITLLFLIFDIEIMLIIPIIFLMKFTLIFKINLIFLSFIFVLLISLLMEWYFNYLNWLN